MGVLGFFLDEFLSIFSFESFSLVAEVSSLATCLVVMAPKFPWSYLCLTNAEMDSEKQGRRGDFEGGT